MCLPSDSKKPATCKTCTLWVQYHMNPQFEVCSQKKEMHSEIDNNNYLIHIFETNRIYVYSLFVITGKRILESYQKLDSRFNDGFVTVAGLERRRSRSRVD